MRNLSDLEMAALLHGGATLQEIGDRVGLSRERVRQRLKLIGVKSAKRVDVPKLLEIIRGKGVWSFRDLSRDMRMAEHSIKRALGELGLGEAVRRLLRMRRRNQRRRGTHQILAAMQTYAMRLGRTPRAKDLIDRRRPSDVPCLETLQRRFGSLREAQRAAGLELNARGRNARTRGMSAVVRLN